MQPQSPIHLGKIIRQTLRQQGRSVTWLARQLPCDRSNLYKIFSKHTLDTEILYRISQLLDTDFFALFSDQLKK